MPCTVSVPNSQRFHVLYMLLILSMGTSLHALHVSHLFRVSKNVDVLMGTFLICTILAKNAQIGVDKIGNDF